MKILYKFASRERPDKFFKCLDNIHSLSRHDDWSVLATLDIDDESMANEEVKERLLKYPRVKAIYGTSRNKIHAVNRDLEFAGPFDILCNHSDDMMFIKGGYDLDIIEAFKGFSGLVHFPDQKAGRRLITYAMMSYDYFVEIGRYIYHPLFESVYADNWQQAQAQKMGKYKYVPKRILDHEHAIWGYGEPDALLLKTENKEVYKRDKETFDKLMKTL